MPNEMIVKLYHYMNEHKIDPNRLVAVIVYNGITTADVCFEFSDFGGPVETYANIVGKLSWRSVSTPVKSSFQAINIVMQTIAKFGGQGCSTRQDILSAFAAQNNADQYSLGFMWVDAGSY